jgi:hypothetical protein
MEEAMPKPAKKDRAPEREGKPTDGESADGARDITPAELRSMIAATALHGAKGRSNGLPMPDDTALANLTATINHWLGYYCRARDAHANAETIRRAERARDALRKEIPALAQVTNALDADDPFKLDQARRIHEMAAALEQFALPPATKYRAPGVPDR